MLIGLLLVGIAAAAYRLRIHRIEARQHTLEAEVAERTIQLREQAVDHWRIVYGKSHLIASPQRSSLEILDTRPAAKRFRHRLTGLKR